MKLRAAWCLLAVACSSASAPSSSSTSSTSSVPKPPAGVARSVERLQIGNLEAYAVADGHLGFPNDGQMLALGRPPSETADLLASAGLPRDTIRLDVQCLLVKANDRVLLFDTGTGNPDVVATGRLVQSLAIAGVKPDAITDIFISHAHGDHIGGLVTKAGSLVFPNATIHMAAPEWAAFRANTDEDSQHYIAAMTPKVAPFAPGSQLLPVVKAIATQGHTPGHSSYEIGADGAKLFYLGDLAHHSIISVQRPAWSIKFDGDRAAAEAMRQHTLGKLAAEGTRVFATHFPFPGIGHVVEQGGGLVWRPEPVTAL